MEVSITCKLSVRNGSVVIRHDLSDDQNHPEKVGIFGFIASGESNVLTPDKALDILSNLAPWIIERYELVNQIAINKAKESIR